MNQTPPEWLSNVLLALLALGVIGGGLCGVLGLVMLLNGGALP